MAIAEDGNVLAKHLSSNTHWAKHDIGITSDWKHNYYKAHYPDGYELVWLDDVQTLPKEVTERNNALDEGVKKEKS
jgi:hypothetical protein